jgi:hypothetical protein
MTSKQLCTQFGLAMPHALSDGSTIRVLVFVHLFVNMLISVKFM